MVSPHRTAEPQYHFTLTAAQAVMAPLFGIYDLRPTDAHLGSSNIANGLARASVEPKAPPATQGRQLIGGFVDTLAAITSILT